MQVNACIRCFLPEDAISLSDIIYRAEHQNSKNFDSPEVIEWWCSLNTPDKIIEKAKDRELWVAVSDAGTVLGVIGLKKNHLRTFYVDPNLQGKGVGRALFELVKNFAIKRGHKTMVVHASPFAVPIYQHFGFRKLRQLLVKKDNFQYEETLLYLKLN